MHFENYADQLKTWPQTGRHILAQYDADSVIVYQAYRPSIADFAVQNQKFGGDFSFGRMSWVKPNFLWMMYRAGWATKQGQDRILGVRIRKVFFDEVLEKAVFSNYQAGLYDDLEDWRVAVGQSDVRLQWDPDHDPTGKKVERRAIQLGLRGSTLYEYGTQAVMEVIDMTQFVTEQRDNIKHTDKLVTPRERVYVPESKDAIKRIGLTT